MDRSLFDQVLDAVEGFVHEVDGVFHARAHRRGLKVWFDDAEREHYEAQLIRVDDEVKLEIGFHAEHRVPADNEAVLDRLLADENSWRAELGPESVAGEFIGTDRWRRISELWDAPVFGDEPHSPDEVIEIAARLADYVIALEPVRRS